MTKLRPPLSIDLALVRIADRLGWPKMAEIAGRTERTVRNWSDPDTRDECPVSIGVQLDLAFERAGGEGHPIFEAYALQLETSRADAMATQRDIHRAAIAGMKETNEAAIAQLRCTEAGADAVTVREAIRETEEAIHSLTDMLAILRRGPGLAEPTSDAGGQS